MKYLLPLTAGLMIATSVAAVDANAGPFDKLRNAVKKVEDTAKDANDAAEVVDNVAKGNVPNVSRGGFANRGSTSNSPRTARAKSHAGVAGPTPARFASATKCANVGLSNAFVAQSGNYTFSQGLSTETRSGLLDRVNVSPSNGCTFPAMGVGDVLYVEVDKNAYNRGRYAMQCVSYDGKEQLDNTNAPRENNYTGKDVMLHTGNSTGYTPTASGSNSSRSGAYEKVLNARGKEMITFNMPGLHTDSGTDFYCQHYNKDTGQSVLAFTFRRGPTG